MFYVSVREEMYLSTTRVQNNSSSRTEASTCLHPFRSTRSTRKAPSLSLSVSLSLSLLPTFSPPLPGSSRQTEERLHVNPTCVYSASPPSSPACHPCPVNALALIHPPVLHQLLPVSVTGGIFCCYDSASSCPCVVATIIQ